VVGLRYTMFVRGAKPFFSVFPKAFFRPNRHHADRDALLIPAMCLVENTYVTFGFESLPLRHTNWSLEDTSVIYIESIE